MPLSEHAIEEATIESAFLLPFLKAKPFPSWDLSDG